MSCRIESARELSIVIFVLMISSESGNFLELYCFQI